MTRTPSSVKRVGGIVLDASLVILAILGVFCAACFAAALLFNVRPLLVSTGSMEPMFGPNSVVFAQEIPAEQAEIGDVTAIQTADMTIPVIHRVIETETLDAGAARIQMQGDANERPDSRVYETETVEKYLFHIPGLASAIAWLSTPLGFTIMAVPVPILFLLIFWPWGETRREREAQEAQTTIEVPAEAVRSSTKKPLPAREPALPVFGGTAEKVGS